MKKTGKNILNREIPAIESPCSGCGYTHQIESGTEDKKVGAIIVIIMLILFALSSGVGAYVLTTLYSL